jgi:hypothetical protein
LLHNSKHVTTGHDTDWQSTTNETVGGKAPIEPGKVLRKGEDYYEASEGARGGRAVRKENCQEFWRPGGSDVRMPG